MPQPLEGCSSGLLLSEWIPCGSFEQRQRIRVGDRGGGDHQDVDCDWIARFFLNMLMTWTRPTKSRWRLFAQSSLVGDDEDISNIGDAGHDGKEKEKENGGYFASPSVPLYDEENVMLGMMVLMMLVMRRSRVTLKFQIQVLHSVLAPWSWWLGLVWDGVSWLFIN